MIPLIPSFSKFGFIVASVRSAGARVLTPVLALALVFGFSTRALAVDVNITADNAYVFDYGPAAGPTSLFGGVENCLSSEIFSCGPGPEAYLGVPALSGEYLYVVTWSDGGVTQGVLGDFTDGSTIVRTGQQGWQVFATGLDIDPDCGPGSSVPSLATVTTQIGLANSNSGGVNSSVGWVGPTGGSLGTIGVLAIGELNDSAAGNFPIVCNILNNARWMWYNPDPLSITDPFRIGAAPNLPNDNNEFLIFRLPAEIATSIGGKTWGRLKVSYR
ncbi:MAG: hypothetical protein HOP12_11805 [Candidatus Eisenbacteria bacterium]|uniref:Uncharacterized protein n=1 Tax=Eiseniibacteriota bacterium TaxID=2212470 RepID=A0A849SGG5_UNCEI|nr:hypothetical protein [Candidatus Eisenbacteria bacterium]